MLNKLIKIIYNYPLAEDESLFAHTVGEFVALKVYDILGNEVATLVNEYKSAGSYEVEFPSGGMRHASSTTYVLPSGIYFYQLKAGDFIQTKKMVLLR